jgi:hypothetical protein
VIYLVIYLYVGCVVINALFVCERVDFLHLTVHQCLMLLLSPLLWVGLLAIALTAYLKQRKR